jgi:hypothetical protein
MLAQYTKLPVVIYYNDSENRKFVSQNHISSKVFLRYTAIRESVKRISLLLVRTNRVGGARRSV